MRLGYIKICSAGSGRLSDIVCWGKTTLQAQFLREIWTRSSGTLVWILVPCFSKMNDHFKCRKPAFFNSQPTVSEIVDDVRMFWQKGGLDMGPWSGVIKVAIDASCVPFETFCCKIFTGNSWFACCRSLDRSVDALILSIKVKMQTISLVLAQSK